MKLRRLLYLSPILAVCISGCFRRVPLATVVLVDPSGSVTAQARKEEFASVGALIPKMQRGDSLVVVPITDDEEADIQGRILRLDAPVRREAYDADLSRFRKAARQEYGTFAANLLAHPGQRTDILGALDVARQELASLPASDRKRLIVLSDFLEDDGQYRFTTAPDLASQARAQQLARLLRRQHRFSLQGVNASLGALSSDDFAALAPERCRAVWAFWSEYLAEGGNRPEIQLDGTGMLATLGTE